MEFLFLTAPAHHAAQNDAVILNAKQLKQWLDALPVMDVIKTVESLHASIEPFNELQIPDDERLKLLEIYYVVMDEILFSYDDMRITMLPISIEERRSIKNDIIWLYLSLANGYKSIVKSGFDNKLRPAKNTTLLVSIYRSMELIVQAMLYAFRSHETPPPLSYLEINQLYMYAEFHHVLDTKIKNINSGHHSTINSLYKQILLLVASDPYRVNSNELIEIYFFLEKFSTLCVIEKSVDCKNEEGKYLIDLMEDNPPQLYEYTENTETLLSHRTIDVWPVVQAFGEELSGEYNLDDHGTEKTLSGQFSLSNSTMEQRFVEILTQQLMGKKIREHERLPAIRKCHVAIGLSSINFYLTNKSRIKKTTEPEKKEGMTVTSIDIEEQADFSLDVWQLRDMSESGCLLAIKKNILTQELIIGDVVVIITNDAEGYAFIQVAFVRWVRGDNDTFKMGVEFIKGTATPVVCQCVGDSQSYDGLYFSSKEDQGLQPRILIEKGLLLQSSKINMILNGKMITIEYLSTVVETSLYSQFNYLKVQNN